MKSVLLSIAVMIAFSIFASGARASVADFSFSGPGVSASGTLTYTLGADGAGRITGVTGVFTDTNAGFNNKPSIVNAAITGLQPIQPVVPLPENVTAPDFSRFDVANGIPSPPAQEKSSSLSYDNTFYPTGSPVVCTDYPFSGGTLDVYGVLLKISNGDVVGIWSNGITPGSTAPDYGMAVADATNTYDYVSGGVTAIPLPPGLPTGLAMLSGLGLVGLVRRRRRAAL
jgi:hypothetical protein